eukprot:2597804-Lingulodinium_polyedra.AAC.1
MPKTAFSAPWAQMCSRKSTSGMPKTAVSAPWAQNWQPYKYVWDAENSVFSTVDTALADVK